MRSPAGGGSRRSCSTGASTSSRWQLFLLASLPFVTDAGWVDRIVLGTLLVLAVLAAAIAAARSYTRRRPRGRRGHRRLARRFVRDTLEGLSDPLSVPRAAVWTGLSLAAWSAWALAAIFAARAVGIELSLVEAVFVTAALNLGVAIPSSPGFVGTYQWLGVAALGVFGFSSEAGLAFAIVMQAVWYVPTTLVGAVLLVRVVAARLAGRRARRRLRRRATAARSVGSRATVSRCLAEAGHRGASSYSSPRGRWIRPSW